MTTSSHFSYSDIKFGIQNKSERHFWAAFCAVAILSSLIGDTLILIASFERDAFKINKVIVTIMQHIALSDLTIALVTALPCAISLVANSWVLGDEMCYVRLYVGNFIYMAGMSLIAVLTTAKFLILRYPLRAASWSKKRVHLVCGAIWVSTMIINPMIVVLIDKDDVHFDYRIYNCEYGYTSNVWSYVLPINGFIFGFVPNMVIVATTIPTLMYLVDARKSASRVKGTVPWQGALPIALNAVVYCISTLPYIIYNTAKRFVHGDSQEWFQVHFYRLCYFLLMINIMSNFYIYTLTIKSFRRFLLTIVPSVIPVPSHNSKPVESSASGNCFISTV